MDKVAADGCHLINKKGGSGWSRLFAAFYAAVGS